MTQQQNGGSNLIGISQYNERLVLQLIRRMGSLPKAEIARITKLSAQTASVIINRLIERKLLLKQSQKISTGKAGQPAIPIAINPNGAFSFGVKIGRRSLDIVLINFLGEIIQQVNHPYDYPDPQFIFPVIENGIKTLQDTLPRAKYERILGVGVAAPNGLGGWQAEQIPAQIIEQWDNIDIRERIQASQEHTVWCANDATAACIASLEMDNPEKFDNYLYLFVGTFIGGGVIINRSFYTGHFNNAGAVGSMPLPYHYSVTSPSSKNKQPIQLLSCASRYLLNEQLEALNLIPDEVLAMYETGNLSTEHTAVIQNWLQQIAPAIAYAITAAVSVIDFEGVILDGVLPQTLTQTLTQRVEEEIQQLNLDGLNPLQLYAGKLGNKARALGAAFLPFYTNFSPDRSILISSERDKNVFNLL